MGDGHVSTLADRQAIVVAALVAGGDVPDGFDPALVRATRTALLRKRAGEVATAWPMLAASFGPQWTAEFGTWAAGRPPAGSRQDGLAFARSLGTRLPRLAAEELAVRQSGRLFGLGHAPGIVAVRLFGRAWVVRLRATRAT
jgi:membrane-associated phospholipid phosphatase